MDESCLATVRLLLRSMPDVFSKEVFALKGGTAINLFVREMPRLSVDIDLVFTDCGLPRNEAMERIREELRSMGDRLSRANLSVRAVSGDNSTETKLLVDDGSAMLKIEVNTILRGTVLPLERRSLSQRTAEWFSMALDVPVLATAELYGGKLVAALDRQHPRDLFDVSLLYEHGGISEEMVECFVVYLASHNRPPHEVLCPRDKDLTHTFRNQFEGMAFVPFTLEQMEAARGRLRDDFPKMLSARHREFLMSLVSGEPDWNLLQCVHASRLPGLQWKLLNLRKLKTASPQAFGRQIELNYPHAPDRKVKI
jgi:predicted nucleotidyltransferase component of viral defense system